MSWTAGWFVVNFAATSSVIVGNKLLFTKLGFPFGYTLTFFHLVFTAFSANFSSRDSKPAKLSAIHMTVLSVGIGWGVPLANLSMRYNSLGFYQLAKVMVLPITLIMQRLTFNRSINTFQLGCCVSICVGMSLVVTSEVALTMHGFVLALGSAFLTAATQLLQQETQKKLNASAAQVMKPASLGAASLALVSLPLFEDLSTETGLRSVNVDSVMVLTILGTCVFGCLVNMSIANIVGKTSAVTYQVFSFAKQVSLLIVGRMLFDSQPMSWANVLGAAIRDGRPIKP